LFNSPTIPATVKFALFLLLPCLYARFGIGVEIELESIEKYRTNEEEIIEEIMFDLLKGSGFNLIETGKGSYSDEEHTYFVVINNPGENLFDKLQDKCKALIHFLEYKEIKYIGQVDLVGGILED
jgi:hypothetical protein